MNEANRLVIVDFEVTGHHSVYMCRIAKAALERNLDVLILTGKGIESYDEFKDLPKHQRAKVTLHVLPGDPPATPKSFAGQLFLQISRWWRLRQVSFNHVGAQDIVFFPYVDSLSYAMALLGSPCPKTRSLFALSMRPPFGSDGNSLSLTSKVKAFLFQRMVSRVVGGLFLIDIRVASSFKAQWPKALASRVHFLPDPSEPPLELDRTEARSWLGASQSAVVLLLFGAVAKRKGLDTLLALLDQPGFPADVHVVIAGEQNQEARDIFRARDRTSVFPSHRLVTIDKVISAREQAALLTAADIIWLVYHGHQGSSGVLVQAGRYRRCSLIADEGLMGWYARERGVGVPVSSRSVPGVLTALRLLAKDPSKRKSYADAAYETFQNNTVEAFCDGIFEVLETSAMPPKGQH